MKFDLTRLKSGIESYIPVDINYEFTKEKLENSDLLELNNVHISATITRNSFDEYEINGNITGEMILPCSVTLKPVKVPLDTDFDVNIADFIKETEEKSIICENILDIFPIIWENILMEIPMKVVSDDVSNQTMGGDGWKFVSEKEEIKTNPELEKLKDLL